MNRPRSQTIGATGFPREPIPHGDREVMAYVARCSCEGCATTDHVHIASSNVSYHSLDLIMKRFKRLGWRLGNKRETDMCPACSGVGRSKREEKPVQAKSKPILVSDEIDKWDPLSAMDRIEPTREERRRIMADLHTTYDPVAGRYKGASNDSTMASALKLPKAWVAKVREDFFGPDKNEDDAARQEAIERLGHRLDKAEGVMERILEEITNIRAELKALRGE